MPQMAPIMWLPLFILIISLLLLTKSSIYFIASKSSNEISTKKAYFNTSWLW